MKVSTENDDNNFGYEQIMIVVNYKEYFKFWNRLYFAVH